MSFFRKKPEKYKKERTLEDDFVKPRSFDNIDLEDNNQNQVDEIFNQIKKDIELGNDLLNLFDEKCRATHIPVPEELQNIRAAVKRKDNTEIDGARISFALFLTAIKKYEKIKLEYSLMIKDGIAGNPELVATRVTNLKIRIKNGITEEDLLVFSSLWLLNYVLNKYQGIFSFPDIAQIAAAGDEQPGAAAAGAAKLVAATAFSAFVDAVYDNYNATRGPSVTSTSNSQTVNPEGLSRTEELALKKIAENDYDIILDYAIKYIYSSNDQKYDPWISYLAVRRSRNSSIDMHSYYPVYSTSEFISVNLGEQNDSGQQGQNSDDYVRNNIRENFKRNFIPFVSTDAETMYTAISAKNRMVFNTAAQASAYKLTKDQVCCLMRIITRSGVDRDTVKTAKCLIRAASTTLSAQLFTGFSSKSLAQLKSLDIGAMILNRIKGIASGMLRKLYQDFLLRINDELATEIYGKCYMFLNFLDIIFDGIDDMVSGIERDYLREKNKIYRDLKNSEHVLHTKFQIRMLNDIELMLASILDNSLEQCVLLEDDVAEERLDEVIGGFNVPSNQYTIDISDEMREKYFSDNKPIRLLKTSATFEKQSGITIPAIDKINSPETSEEVVRNILRTCKIDLTDEQIKQMLKDTDGSSR